jgi:hypothetical protein
MAAAQGYPLLCLENPLLGACYFTSPTTDNNYVTDVDLSMLTLKGLRYPSRRVRH